MSLINTAIRRTKPADKPFKLTDGDGLYLLINPTGSKWWRFDYRFDGKRKTLSLGVYPTLTLKSSPKNDISSDISHLQINIDDCIRGDFIQPLRHRIHCRTHFGKYDT